MAAMAAMAAMMMANKAVEVRAVAAKEGGREREVEVAKEKARESKLAMVMISKSIHRNAN
jgi:hypothetical protein